MRLSLMKKRVAAWGAALMIVGSSTPAAAQQSGGVVRENLDLLLTLVVLTSASTTVYFIQALTDRMLDKAFADTRKYMENNTVALQHDITVGAGQSLEDLAIIYALPERERPAFFARVRTRRAQLMPLLRGQHIKLDAAIEFTEAVLTQHQIARFER